MVVTCGGLSSFYNHCGVYLRVLRLFVQIGFCVFCGFCTFYRFCTFCWILGLFVGFWGFVLFSSVNRGIWGLGGSRSGVFIWFYRGFVHISGVGGVQGVFLGVGVL